jgi:hypothetical protein
LGKSSKGEIFNECCLKNFEKNIILWFGIRETTYLDFWNLLKTFLKNLELENFEINFILNPEVKKANTGTTTISRHICFFYKVGLSDQCPQPLLHEEKTMTYLAFEPGTFGYQVGNATNWTIEVVQSWSALLIHWKISKIYRIFGQEQTHTEKIRNTDRWCIDFGK